LQWYKDPSCVVRFNAAFTSRFYFIALEADNDSNQILADIVTDMGTISRVMHSNQPQYLVEYALILVLGESARKSDVLLRNILFKLCYFGRRLDLSKLCSFILKMIANSWGYTSVQRLLGDHITYLLSSWVTYREEGNTFLDDDFGRFPYHLVSSASDAREFVAEYMHVILPVVCSIEDESERTLKLQHVAQCAAIFNAPLSKTSISKLIQRYLGYILSWLNPLEKYRNATFQKCISWVFDIGAVNPEIFSSEVLSRQISFGLVELAAIKMDILHAEVNVDVIENCFESIGRGIVGADVAFSDVEFSIISNGGPIDLIVHIFQRLQYCQIDKKRVLLVEFLRRVISRILKLRDYSWLNIGVRVTVWMMHACNNLHLQACKLLLELLRSVQKEATRKDLFAPLMNEIMQGIISIVKYHSDSSNAYSSTEVVEEVRTILAFIDENEELRGSISEVDPLPTDLPLLSPMKEIQDQIFYKDRTASVVIYESIMRFCKLHDSSLVSNVSYLESSLSALWQILKNNKSELIGKLHEELRAGELRRVSDPSNNLLMSYAVSCLIKLLLSFCAEKNVHADIRNLCALCLGEIGYLDPSIIEFAETYSDSLRKNGKVMDFRASLSNKLFRYLNDSNASVVAITLNSIRHTLSISPESRSSTKDPFKQLRFLSATSIDDVVIMPPDHFLDPLLVSDVSHHSYDVLSHEMWIDLLPSKGFSIWIRTVTKTLCEHSPDPLFHGCVELVSFVEPFALFIFPYVLYTVLQTETQAFRAKVSSFFETLLKPSSEVIAARLILEAINFLRETHMSRWVASSTDIATDAATREAHSRVRAQVASACGQDHVYDLWLTIDLLFIADAALRCRMFYTASLFTEIWCEQRHKKLTLTEKEANEDDFQMLDTLPPQKAILLQAYENLRVPDAIYGIQGGLSKRYRIALSESEGMSLTTLAAYDAMKRLEGNKETSIASEKLVSALISQGFYHIAQMYLTGVRANSGSDSKLEILQNEIAWRSLEWDDGALPGSSTLPDVKTSKSLESVDVNIYECLTSLQSGNESMFFSVLRASRQTISENFRHWSITEGLNIMSPLLVQLQQTVDLEDAWSHRVRMSSTERGDSNLMKQVVDMNIIRSQGLTNTLSTFEPILALQSISLAALGEKDLLMRHLSSVISTSLKVRDTRNVGLHAMNDLKRVSKKRGDAAIKKLRASAVERIDAETLNVVSVELDWRMKEAAILWDQKLGETALQIATIVTNIASRGHDAATTCRNKTLANQFLWVKGKSLLVKGKWLSESQSESTDSIMNVYLEPAVSILRSLENCKTIINPDTSVKDQIGSANYTIARYLDKLYQTQESYFKSSEWKRWVATRDAFIQEVQILKDKNVKAVDVNLLRRKEIELQAFMEGNRDPTMIVKFRHQALEYYMRALHYTDAFDMQIVYRVIGIWFSNIDNEDINNILVDEVANVPSRKFIPLIYQLAARLGEGGAFFQKVLTAMLQLIAVEHPYHAVFQIIALENGGIGVNLRRNFISNSKIDAAKALTHRLKSSAISKMYDQMNAVAKLYIKLANFSVTNKEKKNTDNVLLSDIPECDRMINALKVSLIAMPTKSHDVRLDRDYSPHIVTIAGFERQVKIIPSGINMPILLTCRGSDGQAYKQLIKADDMRPDAVMEQVFEMVNTLFSSNPATRGRKLSMRTFKVVPLAPNAGVLQWVDNTTPLGSYLVGPGRKHYKLSAHYRYHPNEKTSFECRKLLESVIVKREDTETIKEKNTAAKRQLYKSIMSAFTPVFHHYFLENFPVPSLWFEKRTAYTRSVAVNSMVGYIVGIGDRHNSNILIDNSTAEIVHIDFGVTFEQGKTLPSPERVPFRLTRDVVDGFGITGTEGVFRRCCEETLEVLRANTESIITILNAVVSDPLYKWTVTVTAGLKRQGADKGDGEEDFEESEGGVEDVKEPVAASGDAERVLLRVRQKLQGYEDPEGDAFGVPGQVERLINEATDPNNLCLMYPGWGAWV
jgi:hypothetical protein